MRTNWIGEFGVTGNTYYPELFHNSIWAALASGASMTPAEWNSGGSWGRMTPEMNADLSRFEKFVVDIPLALWNPKRVEIVSSAEQVRGWGEAGEGGGVVWVQDYSGEGKSIEEQRSQVSAFFGVQLQISGMPDGEYTVRPYDTWSGEFLDSFDVLCETSLCAVDLPEFQKDIALKFERK